MRSRLKTSALAVLLLASAGCGSDEPLAAPVQPSPAAVTSAPAPSPSPTPAPSPSPAPLSPFEDDPAVQALRAYVAAVAAAVNAGDLQQPALLELATERRAGLHRDVYGKNLGKHYPFPNPVAVLGVEVVDATSRNVVGCSLEEGLVLDAPGGTPVEPRKVLAGKYELRLEGSRWKVHRVTAAEGVSCDGVALQGEPQ